MPKEREKQHRPEGDEQKATCIGAIKRRVGVNVGQSHRIERNRQPVHDHRWHRHDDRRQEHLVFRTSRQFCRNEQGRWGDDDPNEQEDQMGQQVAVEKRMQHPDHHHARDPEHDPEQNKFQSVIRDIPLYVAVATSVAVATLPVK